MVGKLLPCCSSGLLIPYLWVCLHLFSPVIRMRRVFSISFFFFFFKCERKEWWLHMTEACLLGLWMRFWVVTPGVWRCHTRWLVCLEDSVEDPVCLFSWRVLFRPLPAQDSGLCAAHDDVLGCHFTTEYLEIVCFYFWIVAAVIDRGWDLCIKNPDVRMPAKYTLPTSTACAEETDWL